MLEDEVKGLRRLLSDAEEGREAELQHADAMERRGGRAAGRGLLARGSGRRCGESGAGQGSA